MKLALIRIVTILSLKLTLMVKSDDINCSVGESKYFCSIGTFTYYIIYTCLFSVNLVRFGLIFGDFAAFCIDLGLIL